MDWRLDGGEGGGPLNLDGVKTGGPRTAPPSRRGFGTRLIAASIERELADAVARDLDPDGLRCTIAVPLSQAGAGHMSPLAGATSL